MSSHVDLNTRSGGAGRLFALLGSRAHFFELVWLLVKRELKVKYRGSVLGYAWSMLNPLLFMLIITTVFSFMIRGVENYGLFVLSGILFWNLCSVSITLGTGSIVNNASLIRKVKVPIWVFPFVPIGSCMTNFLLALIPYVLFFAFKGRAMPEQLYLMPVILMIALVFVAGIVLALSSLNAFFRDVAHMLEPAMVLCFYATPVIYDRTTSGIPEKVQTLLLLNPFTHYIEAFRATAFGGSHVTLQEFLILIGLAACSLLIGGSIYKTNKSKFIYAI